MRTTFDLSDVWKMQLVEEDSHDCAFLSSETIILKNILRCVTLELS